jgi:16S rRNA (guanine527-N7)-methyltransferase
MGTGAGIPGILIKIEMPEIRVVLLDSIRKKIGFCAAAIRKLELKDISAVVGRAENAEVILSLGRFDVIVSRGTWKLDAYVKLAAPYMKNAGTRVVALKGPDWQQELANAKDILEKNNMKLMAADEYSLEDGRKRCLVVLGNST